MTDQTTEAPNGPLAPSGDVTWKISDWSEKRPFTGRLLWSDDTGPLLGIALDPVLVRELFERLAVVRLAQCEALGVSIDPDSTVLETHNVPNGDDEQPSALNPVGEVAWEIADWSEKRPFTGHILWSDDTGPLLGVALDPVLVRELFERLALVHLAQCETLGAPIIADPEPDTANTQPATETNTGKADSVDPSNKNPADDADDADDDVEPVDDRPWRKRHYIFFFFACLIGSILATAVLFGACSVQTLPF